MSARPSTRPPAPPRPSQHRLRSALHPLAVTVLVALVVLGAATATPWRVGMPEAVLPPADAPPAPPPPPASSGPVPQGEPTDTTLLTTLVVILTVLGAAVLAVLVVLLARRLLAHGPATNDTDPAPPGEATAPGEATPAIPLAELADGVQRALAHVDAATTPHDAVVAAWVALEDTAADHGTTRHHAQTPTEFTTDLLAGTPAPARHVTTLRTLYAEARFTDRPVSDAQVARARDALTHIAASLDDPPSPAPTPEDAP